MYIPSIPPISDLRVCTAGEVNITRGCGKMGIIQMISSNASLSVDEICAARLSPAQPLFYQLYKKKDDAKAAARIREVEALGCKAIFLTVDAPTHGNRERDVRAPFVLKEQERIAAAAARKDAQGGEAPREPEDEEELDFNGTAGALLANDDADMTWEKVSVHKHSLLEDF